LSAEKKQELYDKITEWQFILNPTKQNSNQFAVEIGISAVVTAITLILVYLYIVKTRVEKLIIC
jgi:hypothetical protein